MATRMTLAGTRRVLALGVVMLFVGLAGCQADYGADITNRSSQPVFASIMRKGSSGAVLGASRRLGPGDRAFVGPVRTTQDHGAYLTVHTMGTSNSPVSTDLLPGEAFFEVHQDGQGANAPLRLVPKP